MHELGHTVGETGDNNCRFMFPEVLIHILA